MSRTNTFYMMETFVPHAHCELNGDQLYLVYISEDRHIREYKGPIYSSDIDLNDLMTILGEKKQCFHGLKHTCGTVRRTCKMLLGFSIGKLN